MSAKIRGLRKLRGWSQEELGKRVGLHQTSISAIESNSRPIRVNEVEDMAAAFGVTFEYFFQVENSEHWQEIAEAEAAHADARDRVLALEKQLKMAETDADNAMVAAEHARHRMAAFQTSLKEAMEVMTERRWILHKLRGEGGDGEHQEET